LEKHLHIVSFDVPYPPDYGGVIPIFALLRKLKEEGPWMMGEMVGYTVALYTSIPSMVGP